VRSDAPSFTAQGVAAARLRLDRPFTPTGDPGAEARLARSVLEDVTARGRANDMAGDHGFWAFLEARTRFFDAAVLRAIAHDVRQVVILAAGYDGRALRFRTPGVRFFEVDHPATQRDKRERLARVNAATDDITFVAADFNDPQWPDALAHVGYDSTVPTLFTCEGLLRYLTEDTIHRLLRASADAAAPASTFTVSISTSETGDTTAHRDQDLAAIGEPVFTVPPRATALQWLADAGWTVTDVETGGETRNLVTATR
jgi:methyltransferase (TIGR00027 family)